MQIITPPKIAVKRERRQNFAWASGRGYTMSEIIIVIVVLGLLAAIAVPIYNNVRNSGADNVKIKNADTLNQLMTTIHNGGVDTTAWTDSAGAISALRAGVSIPSANPAAAAQQILLEKDVNPAAYKFTAGTKTTAPLFDPILDQPSVRP
jgi:prepilin-type N-terminal cleavage/methylation domain-containing protein